MLDYKHIFNNNYDLVVNSFNTCDGLYLLNSICDSKITVAFFDPQYRGVMDKLSYGNEGARQKQRFAYSQMTEEIISTFIQEISRVLIKSGYLFLWVDKYHLCEGITHWLGKTSLKTVDLVTWDKQKMGMGYRTRKQAEYLLVLQKTPIKAKSTWHAKNIRDVWSEKIINKIHPHQKPQELQISLIEAVSKENDIVLDPCAGSYSVLDACKKLNRVFIGSDLKVIKKY